MARVDERSTDGMAEGLEEGVSHSPADEHAVGLGRQRAHDTQLVFDLGTADDDDERPRRSVEKAREDLDLAGHEASGSRRQVLRRPDYRGVCSM